MRMFESLRQGLQEAVDFAEGKPVKAVVHDVSPPGVKTVHEHVGKNLRLALRRSLIPAWHTRPESE